MSEGPSLEVRDLVKHFPLSGGLLSRQKKVVRAVVMKLLEPTSGTILLGGTDVTHLDPGAMWPHRRQIQLVFQDPYSSLNPRLSAGTIVGEPLENFGLARGSDKDRRVAELFKRVGLRPEAMRKYPHEFSGGQRQRLGIAKALAVNPDVIVADEPVSALDVSVQAQVLNLLIDLQDEYRLTYLFISHDLGVMRHVSHRIAVMYLGRIVELTDKRTLFSRPLHPYTEALLAAAPIPDPTKRKARRRIVQGEVPSPTNPPSGCHFHPRCPYVLPACRTIDPPLVEVLPGQRVACIRREPGAEPAPLTPTR
jgi:peptide/nickel transport system ATP-binding protein/oligopeptide transport system ATP-binding protein